MRVVLFSNWLPPIPSGSSFYTSSLAHSLVARGHDVLVVTLDWGATDNGAESNYRVERLPVCKAPRLPLFYNLRLMGFAFNPGNRQRLIKLLKDFRADILHHVNHIFDTTFLTLSAARAVGIPVIGSITTPIQHQNALLQTLMQWADQCTVGAFGVQRWDGIVSLDHIVHEYVGSVYGAEAQKRSRVIPYGVRSETIKSYEPPHPAFRDRAPLILHVGHLHPFRNPTMLIRAIPQVLRAVPNARLELIGRVDLQEPVEVAKSLGLTETHVSFRGEMPHDNIVPLMKSARVFASWVTGPYHGLGTAPMEAMLCETPVVNDLNPVIFGEGALRDGENIQLVDSHSPDSIAKALIRLLTDEAYANRLGQGGRQFVMDHLSWGPIAAKMENFYKDIIAQTRS